MTRRLLRSALLWPILLGAACDDDPFSPPARLVIGVSGLRLYLELGDTARFEAVVRDSAWNAMPQHRITWRSSDPIVLTVDSSGFAVARRVGRTQITATATNASTMWTLTVIPPVAAVRIVPESVTLVPTDRERLTLELLDASGQSITDLNVLTELAWQLGSSVTDSFVATIAHDGIHLRTITAHREGRTWVTAHYRDLADSIPLSVVLLLFAEVVVGGERTCARTTTDAYYCWPRDESWFAPQWVPRRLTADVLISLTMGTVHGCGLNADRAALCFGSNEYGQRGLGTTTFAQGLTPVSGSFRFTSLAAGDLHTCGITVNHVVVCWGLTQDGQAGDSILTCASGGKFSIAGACAPAPQLLRDSSAGLPFTSLSAGSSHTCGLRTDSLAYCWGRLAGVRADVPRQVSPSHRFVALASGRSMACGLDAAGSAHCWGDDVDGLGDGHTSSSATPIVVAGGLRFRGVARAGLQGSAPSPVNDGGMCAIGEDGALMCWGTAAMPTPTRVAAPLLFTSVSLGTVHGCGLSTDRLAYCWGPYYLPALGSPASAFERDVPSRVVGQRGGGP